ncbi:MULTISPECIES: hypothetical protein [Methylomonas]|uniref:Uncharacterized protein n=1 Tax=Methylomonas koyamae TaxID=702114 RepID=A0AA91DGC6_9GAMM|nr:MULTISPECIES: hypothetical protein [Methylomonas]OAI30241.1 hypothetical protein A1356_21880 [Methylomonas koyamae]
MNNSIKDTAAIINKRKCFRMVKYVNGFFLSLSFVFILASYDLCGTYKGNYKAPALTELKQVTGKYVSFRNYTSPTYGRLLTKGYLKPLLCGYMHENLQGQDAIGWVDKTGNLYQIEVGGQLVCNYDDVVRWHEGNRVVLYISIFIFIVLSVTQFIFWKLEKLIYMGK